MIILQLTWFNYLPPENQAWFQVREEGEEAQKAINDLQWRSDLVNKKIQECLDATKVVMKIQKQTDDSIEDLGFVTFSEWNFEEIILQYLAGNIMLKRNYNAILCL